MRGKIFGRKIYRADQIKNPSRLRGNFLSVYDGEDAEIFQPNAPVVNRLNRFAQSLVAGVGLKVEEKNIRTENRSGRSRFDSGHVHAA